MRAERDNRFTLLCVGVAVGTPVDGPLKPDEERSARRTATASVRLRMFASGSKPSFIVVIGHSSHVGSPKRAF